MMAFELKKIIPLSRSLLFPGIMGIFSYIPFLQTYHGIVSMNHQIKGKLVLNNRTISFGEKAKGYTEKDWGKSFPSAWIWMQTNHFQEIDVSFVCAIANVLLFNTTFTGFSSVLWYKNKFYRFTSSNFSKIRYLQLGKDKAIIGFKNRNFFLMVKAIQGDKVKMKAPKLGTMKAHSYESMDLTIQVRLLKKHRGKCRNSSLELLFHSTGDRAGLESMNVEKLKSSVKT